MYVVELTYFKQSGKYYSEGLYYTRQESLLDIWDEVGEKRSSDQLPGISGGKEFIILVNVPKHPHAHPKLLV